MPRILIVDDDEIDRELAERCLRGVEDLQTVHACDGQEALELLGRDSFALILTDLMMPRMDGLELVEKVREEHPSVPVVLMTAVGSEQTAVRALQSGAASYVAKSALKTELLDAVEMVLETVHARRSRKEILQFLGNRETRFELSNDPSLISPLGAYFEETLERLGFGDATTRGQVGIAIHEAVSNAMIHGNLEVSSDLRRSDRGDYQKKIAERQMEKPYSDRRVLCLARESLEEVEYVIEDEGPGFNWSTLPDPTSPEGMLMVSGRGIWLIRTFMDKVEFNEVGNRIRMSKKGP